MMYEIIPTLKFKSDIEYYIRKRRFINITDDIDPIVEELKCGNFIGDPITEVVSKSGSRAYKVRAVNSNTNAGKSNGYRLIYYAVSAEQTIYLLTIYYKKDDKQIPTKQEIARIIKRYCE